MMSRGKKLVSLVVINDVAIDEIGTDIGTLYSDIQEPQSISNNDENMMDSNECHQTLTVDSPTIKMPSVLEAIPNCSKWNREGKESDDAIEKELESLFGDISDTDDPTYHPENYCPQMERSDSIELITLDDLLGNKENVIPQGEIHSEATAVVDNLLTELLKKTWLLINPKKRWRKSDPSSWARNVAKKRRADGLPYVTKSKVRPAKVPKDIDCSKCQFKCTDVFVQKDREDLCRFYWNLDFQSKKNFILSNLVIQLPKRILSAHNRRRTEKKYTKKCFLTKNNEARQVCQKFFSKTLCISPSVITDAIKKRNDMNCFDACDARGGHEPVNKTKPDIIQSIRSHIASFPCMEAHYSRKDTQRRYLDKNLNVRKMYLLYEEECLKNELVAASEITYRRIFSNEYNLSFFVPRKDQCLTCTNYAQATAEKKKELEDAYLAHQERKKTCNKEKEKDKIRANSENSFSSVTFDLQAVLQIPTCDVGLLYYSRKLCVYNLTVYEAGLPNDAYCFPWSEVNGKKGSCEIGTILLYYLTNCVPENITEISLFSDTCGGQNRNQFIAALLLWAVQKIGHLKVIEQKFLESGHSHMEADSMHSSIETAKKNAAIYSMMDWISIFKRARRKKNVIIDGKKVIRQPYRVKEFKYDEFFDLKHLAQAIIQNRTKDQNGKPVQWFKIKRIRYIKGEERKIYFNYDMSEHFNAIEVGEKLSTSKIHHEYSTRKKMRGTVNETPADQQFPDQLNRVYQEPIKITEAKKRDLINLCRKGIIPEELHGWFENMETEKRSDRLPEPAIGESESEETD
ncbi:hypothetical protein ACJJTC_008656 [Scirpophaga incertulas]